MEGHFGECFNEDMVLRIALESFVDARTAHGGQHTRSLFMFRHTQLHTHKVHTEKFVLFCIMRIKKYSGSKILVVLREENVINSFKSKRLNSLMSINI